MLDACEHLVLAFERIDGVRLRRRTCENALERSSLAGFAILDPVDNSHPARGEFLLNDVPDWDAAPARKRHVRPGAHS